MVYIRSAFAISPQDSFEQMLTKPVNYIGDQLRCIEPDYSKYIDPKLIRRMSRIIKMGAAAAMECLRVANIQMPDAIITGTAYGCLADTNAFLTRMIEFNEELLSPTSFIQSTHNTVGAQIALMLQCHHYNNTYVHRGFSFESALLDAISLINEKPSKKVLVGSVDEITENSHAILSRFGLYKSDGDNLQLMPAATPGTMAGEGSSFFLLSGEKTNTDLAKLEALKTYYQTEIHPEELFDSFLAENNLKHEDIDVMMLGSNGDARHDKNYDSIANELFPHAKKITYKQYCGEYPTAAAFGLWMAAHVIHTGKLPGQHESYKPKNILIYNNYMQAYPALYLLSEI